MTISQAIKQYLEHIEQKDLSQNTIDAYWRVLGDFSRYVGNHRIDQLTIYQVKAWRKYLSRKLGLRPGATTS